MTRANECLQWWLDESDQGRGWRWLRFLGYQIYKHPFDLWVMQEIVTDVRPTLVIECGTRQGGSAVWFAVIMQALGIDWRVVTIDIEQMGRSECPNMIFLEGDSKAPSTVEAVRKHIRPQDRILVDLDSDHSTDHVRAEMEAYAPLVSVGSYLIVEDGCKPGPLEAIEPFLLEHPEFEPDLDREMKFSGVTQNPKGYLKRIR